MFQLHSHILSELGKFLLLHPYTAGWLRLQ